MTKTKHPKKQIKASAHRSQRARTPRSQALPGLEEIVIPELEDAGGEYRDTRDRRMVLTEAEVGMKTGLLALMRKHGKTHYTFDGLEILVIPGEDDVKVRTVKKPKAPKE